MGRARPWQGLLLVLALTAGAPQPAHAATASQSPDCSFAATALAASADAIMAGSLVLPPHRAVRIPIAPTWHEDLRQDANWGFQYHSLRWIGTLLQASRETGREDYRRRASTLLRDWYVANPPGRSASPMAWNDHAAAWRSGVYACATHVLGRPGWLLAAIRRHGMMLADPAFYVGRGNHALNQDIGLLDAGLALARRDWVDLAIRRVARVIETDIDPQGANTEGAVGYQGYIYERACVARTRIRDAGRPVPAVFARVDLMPTFLAFATLPDGTLDTLGDTEAVAAPRVPSASMGFVTSTDSSGGKMGGAYAVYRQGYAFGRTGWGVPSGLADEIAYSIRFGPAPSSSHQHEDGGSLALYGYGRSLLVDPGKYAYEASAWRAWVTSRPAHNVVTVEGVASRPAHTTMLTMATGPTMRLYRVRTATYPGTTLERVIIWSAGGGYLIVDDRATSSRSRTLTQRWHLAPGSSAERSAVSAWTRLPRGNVLVRQLNGGRIRIVSGTRAPIQGWYSPAYGTRVAAPVIETRKTGSAVRFLTLIVPSAGPRPSVAVSGLRLFPDGFDVRVAVNGREERVIVRSAGASVTPLG